MKAWYIQVRGAQRELALSFFPPSSLLIPDLVLNKPRFLLLIPILGKPWSLIAGIRFPIHFPLCFHFDRWWWLTAIGSPRSRTLRRRVSMDMSARYHSSCYLFELIVFFLLIWFLFHGGFTNFHCMWLVLVFSSIWSMTWFFRCRDVWVSVCFWSTTVSGWKKRFLLLIRISVRNKSNFYGLRRSLDRVLVVSIVW